MCEMVEPTSLICKKTSELAYAPVRLGGELCCGDAKREREVAAADRKVRCGIGFCRHSGLPGDTGKQTRRLCPVKHFQVENPGAEGGSQTHTAVDDDPACDATRNQGDHLIVAGCVVQYHQGS